MDNFNKDQKEFWNSEKGEIWVSLEQKIDRMLEPFGKKALKELAPRTGEKVLDVGCGTATATLDIARLIGSTGYVLGVDISEPILACAKKKLETSKSKNVDLLLTDAQDYEFPTGYFDAIFSRFGSMFFENPKAAFKNLINSVKSNGRLTLVCWANRSDNDWIEVSSKAASQFLDLPAKSKPREPGPFAFEDSDYLKTILENVGWSNITFTHFSEKHSVGKTPKEAANFLSSMGPMSIPFKNAEETVRDKVINSLEQKFSEFKGPNGVELNFSTWIVSASKL